MEGSQIVLYWMVLTLWTFYHTFTDPFRCQYVRQGSRPANQSFRLASLVH